MKIAMWTPRQRRFRPSGSMVTAFAISWQILRFSIESRAKILKLYKIWKYKIKKNPKRYFVKATHARIQACFHIFWKGFVGGVGFSWFPHHVISYANEKGKKVKIQNRKISKIRKSNLVDVLNNTYKRLMGGQACQLFASIGSNVKEREKNSQNFEFKLKTKHVLSIDL